MFKELEILIGFAIVMAGISMVITVLTQMVSSVFAFRGSNLREGVENLLRFVGAADQNMAKNLADKILRHHLVSESFLWRRLATAIRSEELIAVMRSVIKNDEFSEVRDTLEKRTDEIRAWFDSAMDRTSQKFVAKTRTFTVLFSFLLAFALHLDSVKLLNQLSSNAEARTILMQNRESLTNLYDKLSEKDQKTVSKTDWEQHKKTLSEIGETLGRTELKLLEDNYVLIDWVPGYEGWFFHLAGIVASAIFLSLGAPFWFNLLKSLTSLKPIPAQKERKEREDKEAAEDKKIEPELPAPGQPDAAVAPTGGGGSPPKSEPPKNTDQM